MKSNEKWWKVGLGNLLPIPKRTSKHKEDKHITVKDNNEIQEPSKNY